MTALESLSLGAPQAVTLTLALILVVTLCFLPRPSRATLLWVLAFATAMLGISALIVAVHAENEGMRRGALGAGLCAIALIWCGLRSWRGLRPLTWVAVLYGFLSTAVLTIVPDAWYGIAFRLVLCLAGVFAGLGAWELGRTAERRLPAVVAFQVASTLFGALGATVLVMGIAAPQTIDEFAVVRGMNGVAIIAYTICAVVGLSALAQGTSVAPLAEAERFARAAHARLRRARDHRERDWAFLAVHLDDLAELRAVHSPGEYGRLVSEFERIVTGCLPAGADIGTVSEGRVFVLIDRPEAVIRGHIRALLDAVEETPTSPHVVALSASVGWVPAVVADYDADALRARATEAAARAAAEGGDRWHRVRFSPPARAADDAAAGRDTPPQEVRRRLRWR